MWRDIDQKMWNNEASAKVHVRNDTRVTGDVLLQPSPSSQLWRQPFMYLNERTRDSFKSASNLVVVRGMDSDE